MQVQDYDVLELSFDSPPESPKIHLDKQAFLSAIDSLVDERNMDAIKGRIDTILEEVKESPDENRWTCPPHLRDNGYCHSVYLDVFQEDLLQILEAKGLERARYYLKRMKKSFTREKKGKINEINLNRWKEYKHIHTDSLWVVNRRDRTGGHMASYWGNFIPQIPQQMMERFTRQGDYVLDTFSGSGTTMLECRRMGRNGIGIELNPEVAERSGFIIDSQENPFETCQEVICGNSEKISYPQILEKKGIDKVQLVVMHPPYFDIIKFSNNEEDLSNSKDVEDFLARMEATVRNFTPILEDGRYMCLVIGDKYTGGEWVPLGFQTMQRVLDTGHYKLKSIIVKNFQETKGKRNQKELWRYRAIVGGFYVFKHEYIFLFQKE